jgi:tryptophan-rich sensory protein
MSENDSPSSNGFLKFIVSLGLTLGAGFIAGLFSQNAGEVYSQLILPSFAPPSWVFMPVWTVLYALMGIALFLVWTKGRDNPCFKSAISYFMLQLLFNVLWSVLFFTLGLRVAALVDIIILLIYIIFTTAKFFKINTAAGLLMIPYIIWVAYAALLNLFIVMLNG